MSRSKPVPNARAASAALRREIQARAVAPPAPRMAGNRLNSAWSQADRALGGWLPGGGVANPLSGTVRAATDWKRAATLQDVKQQAVSSGSAGDALGFLGVPVLGAAAQGIQKLIKPLASRGTTPSLNTYVNRASAQQRVVQSADQYLGRMGSGVLPYAMATGTSKVPVSAMIDIGEASSTGPIGPHYRPENLGTKGTVNVFSNSTPGWVIAHEFGHAADHVKRPKAWMDFNQMSKFSEAQERRFINNARGRMLSPGAIVSSAAFAGGGDRKRSVLEAGVEGGFLGIAANWDLLSKEVLADVHGRVSLSPLLHQHLDRAKSIISGSYDRDGSELSGYDKTGKELEQYEKTPGFQIPLEQKYLMRPYYPEAPDPEWHPEYQRHQFNELTDPGTMFPVT
jgi:hypothetical protein